MEYIKVFATEQERESALVNPEHRILSVVRGTKALRITPGPDPIPLYVEIGGIKWGVKNIGASTIYDKGLCFIWDTPIGYEYPHSFEQKDDQYYDTKTYNYTKYKAYGSDHRPTLEAMDDAATQILGSDWRMPTQTELESLLSNANCVWTENYNNSGVNGLVCTDKTDNSKVIFFPASGKDSYSVQTDRGYVRSSSLNTNDNYGQYTWCLYYTPTTVQVISNGGRSNGLPVRGVFIG